MRRAVPWGGRGSGGPAPPPTLAHPPSGPSPAPPPVCRPWGAWPPVPPRLVPTRLLWVRSVRRPGAQAWARLFFAAPMRAGGWGGGAAHTPAPLSGGGGPSALPRGVGAGGAAAGGLVGGRGGGCRAAASLFSLRAAACGTPFRPFRCRWRAPFRRARAVGAEVPPRGGRGVRGGPWTAPPGGPADLNPPSVTSEWAVVTGGSCGARPPSCSVVRVAPARQCRFAGAGPAAVALTASPFLLSRGAPPRPWGGGGPRLWLPS